MKKILSKAFFMICLCVSKDVSTEESDLNHFHICTVASKKTDGLKRLLESCRWQHIEMDILGLDLPYKGNGQKLCYVRDYVNSIPEHHIILFVDGYDVLFLADKKTILQKFLNFNAPFVISMEKGMFPFEHETYSPTPFRYINSGGYMGYVAFLKRMLNSMEIDISASDQGQLIRYYLLNPALFCFDYQAEIFLSLYKVGKNEVKLDDTSQTVRCLLTNTFPCVLHDNGSNLKGIYYKVWKLLCRTRSH